MSAARAGVSAFAREHVGSDEAARVAEWQRVTGWRILGRDRGCYRWIFGRRHVETRLVRGERQGCDCHLDDLRGTTWDHARRVKSPSGQRAILLQPYHLSPERVAELTAYCEPRGLVWVANGMSPYDPAALAVIVQPAGVPPVMPWPNGTDYVMGGAA